MPLLRKRVKTNSKIKQQKQTLITSKIFVRCKKQNLITVNIPSDEPKTKQNNSKNHQKRYRSSPYKGLVTIRQKRTKTVKLKNSLIFLKQLTSKFLKPLDIR